ncbi:hypothetical protein [Polaromonas eurypsychrophila]
MSQLLINDYLKQLDIIRRVSGSATRLFARNSTPTALPITKTR